jgi:hypothetical protein
MAEVIHRKAQSAMEYLMTYGWAILIVIVVAASFYFMGLFNPAMFAGRTVTGFQVLGTPVDWELLGVNGNLTLKLANGRLQTPVTIHAITATINGQDTSYVPAGLTIGPGASSEISFPVTPPLAKGSTYSVKIAILYDAGGLNHTDFGTVTGLAN